MTLARTSFVVSLAASLSIGLATSLALVLLPLGCGKEPEVAPSTPMIANPPAAPESPPTEPAKAPASEKKPEPAEREVAPRLRDFEIAHPREADLAFVVHGHAELGLFARGAGPIEIAIEQEGAPAQTATVAVAADVRTPTAIVLPGSGARALVVRAKAPTGTTLEKARLKDEPPQLPPARELQGALRGRSLFVIVCDALHAGHVKSWGAARETTPNVDALVKRGVRFTSARSQAPWTVPSVTTFLTGLEQERHGVRDIGKVLDATVPSLAEAFQAAGYATAAFVQNPLVNRESGLARGFDLFDGFAGEGRALMFGAIDAWLKTPREKPAFVYIHFMPPHTPYAPPPEFATKFDSPEGLVDGTDRCIDELNKALPKPGDPKVKKLAGLYDNHVAYGDHLVGEIVKRVDADGASGAEKPAILFLSDHGEGFAQHGVIGHLANVHDEMVHVPLVLVAPGSKLPAGAEVRDPVWTPDFAPSLAELFGLDVSEEIAGRSWVGLVEEAAAGEGAGAGARAHRVLRLSARYHIGEPDQRAIVFGRFKLVAPAKALKRANALFDVEADPGETKDVAAEHPIVAAALRAELSAWVAEGVTTASGSFTPDAELEKQLRELGYVGK